MSRLIAHRRRQPRSEAQAFFAEGQHFPLAGCLVLTVIITNVAATVAMLVGAA